jgi:hypothetical protein
LQTNVTENSRDKQERTIATFGAEETERKRKSQNKKKMSSTDTTKHR